MATLEQKIDLDGSHWYSRDGKPVYTMLKADKSGARNTTLRDARKHKLLPSVTTVFSIMAKPGLERWKIGKAIAASLGTPRDKDEPDERYHKRIMDRSFEETDKAAKLGTRIHDAIDAAFDGVEPDEDLKQYVNPTMAYLHTLNLKDIQREGVVVNLEDGYAGRVDLIATFGYSKIIIDFKSKKTTEGVKVTPFEFQPTQIAAYAMAAFGTLDNCYGANVYISTTEAGRIETAVYDSEKLKEEYTLFQSMVALWRAIKKYDPRNNAK
jgi:hypothetical protein